MRSPVRLRVLAPAMLVAGLAVVALAQATTPGGVVRPDDADRLSRAELGAQLFAGNCAMCHGARGEGVRAGRQRTPEGTTGRGPPLRGVGARAADFYLRRGLMPLSDPHDQPEAGDPVFNEREIRALVAHVASLGDGPPIPRPQPERASVARGKRLFTESCAGCHQEVAEGGVVTGGRVPALKGLSARTIAEAVRIGPYVMPTFSERTIDDRELDAIIAYVQSVDPPNDRGGWGIGHLGPIPEGMVTWLIAAVALIAVCVVIGRRVRG